MSKDVPVVPANNDVAVVDFSYRNLSWKVDFERMNAADNKGRLWFVKENGDDLYLDLDGQVCATITCDDVRKSYRKHRGSFLKKWLGNSLITS